MVKGVRLRRFELGFTAIARVGPQPLPTWCITTKQLTSEVCRQQ